MTKAIMRLLIGVLSVATITSVIATAQVGHEGCFDPNSVTEQYFPKIGGFTYTWLARRLCLMHEPSLAEASTGRSIRCSFHDSFSSVVASVRLSETDCQLVLTELYYADRDSRIKTRQTTPIEHCADFVKAEIEDLEGFTRAQQKADGGSEYVWVDGAEWIYEWRDASGHHVGIADVYSAKPKSRGEVACEKMALRINSASLEKR